MSEDLGSRNSMSFADTAEGRIARLPASSLQRGDVTERDEQLLRDGRIRRARRQAQRKRRQNVALAAISAALGVVVITAGVGLAMRGRANAETAKPKPDSSGSVTVPSWFTRSTKDAVARVVAPKPEPTPVFARFNALALRLPVPPDALTEVGFHQAARTYALHMNTDLTKFACDDADKHRGTGKHTVQGIGNGTTLTGGYLRMWRSRPGPPDSAVDVGANPGTPVFSPVNGRVVKIRHYMLYGKLADWEIHIRPDGHPKIDLVVIHVDGLKAREGDRVQAGITKIAEVRKISNVIDSQLADYTKNGGNHVHFQLNDASNPEYKGLQLPDAPGLSAAPGS